MMKRRVLFVDDDPNVLAGLRQRLRRQRDKWDMTFVEGGERAVATLAESAVDVIVSDMRMPGMDGVALLKRVQEEHPEVVRIVLSGHAEMEAAMRAVPVAHQFLSKPCEAGVIEEVVERACFLQDVVNDDTVKAVVGRIESLPTLPAVYAQLQRAMADPDVTVAKVADILEQDLALAAKVLQLVNSAFFRLARTMSRVQDAVSYLGFATIKQVVLAAEVFEERPGNHAIDLVALQRHSLLTASIAARMFEDKKVRDDAFVAGLLHDIGKLLLAVDLPDHMDRVVAGCRGGGASMHEVEVGLGTATHAEIGAYLLGIWGLPYPIVEAVTHHHTPSRVPSTELDLVAAIHVGDVLAHEVAPASIGGAPALDPTYVDALVGPADLERWRGHAEEAAAETAARM